MARQVYLVKAYGRQGDVIRYGIVRSWEKARMLASIYKELFGARVTIIEC